MARIELSNIGGGGTTLSLTTTGTSGAATLAGSVLNIPVYQSALTNPVTGTGTATRVAFWDSASSVSSSSDLYWDSSNSRLGVGNSSPGARLQVNGSGLTSGTTALSVKDSGGTDNFTVADNGATFVRGVLTVSGSSASNATTLMGRTVSGEVASISVGSGLTLSGNTLTVSGGSGIASLNGLTASTQTFATGTAGNDFNISSATSTHTFNLPTASATNRGALSSADWSTFNNKIGGSGVANQVPYFSAASALAGNTQFTYTPNSTFNLAISTSTSAITLGNLNSANNPTFALTSSRGTIPNFGAYASGTNNIGQISAIGTNINGMIFSGYTTATASAFSPLIFSGYHGSTSPTAAAVLFAGFKHLSTSPNRQNLADNEVIAEFANGTNTPLVSYLGNGNVNIGRASSAANTARLQVRGSGASAGTTALIIENSTPSTLFQVLNDGATTLNGTLAQNGTVTMSDGSNIAVGSTNGTKIGTATTQKIGFYNATPIARPDTAVAEAAFVENAGGTAVNVDSTFGGYTLQQVVQALQNLGLLA